MLNPLNFFSKFIKSSNQKELDRISKIVENVNSFEATIKEITDEEGTSELIEEEFALLLEKIKSNKKNDLQNSKKELKEFLANEIVSRYYYQEGRIIERLQHDKDIEEALRLLDNLEEYQSILKVNE